MEIVLGCMLIMGLYFIIIDSDDNNNNGFV